MTRAAYEYTQERQTVSQPKGLLHLEGAVTLIAATVAYFALGYAWWVFLLLLLAPDLSAAGYLVNKRVGSLSYNLAHFVGWPLLVGGAGLWLDSAVAVQLALIWLAHIGMDRLFGYGFKYPDAFKHTHLQEV